MNKKLILIIIIVIIAIGLIVGSQLQSNTFKVGSSDFTLPEGYEEGTPNKNGAVNITNGSDTYFITEFEANETNSSIKAYTDYCEKNNISIIESNLNINGETFYKVTGSSNGAVHYWFNHGDKGYTIYTWKETTNSDGILANLTKSLN